GMLLKTLVALQKANPGFETRQVLAVDVPVISFNRKPEQIQAFYRDVRTRLAALPGVAGVALTGGVPWRDFGPGQGLAFTIEGLKHATGEEDPRAKFRSVTPGYFAALNIPLLEGRDFTEADRDGTERVVVVSRALADRLFPGEDVLNRHLSWTDSIAKFIN